MFTYASVEYVTVKLNDKPSAAHVSVADGLIVSSVANDKPAAGNTAGVCAGIVVNGHVNTGTASRLPVDDALVAPGAAGCPVDFGEDPLEMLLVRVNVPV
jgi:hypothetical protein